MLNNENSGVLGTSARSRTFGKKSRCQTIAIIVPLGLRPADHLTINSQVTPRLTLLINLPLIAP